MKNNKISDLSQYYPAQLLDEDDKIYLVLERQKKEIIKFLNDYGADEDLVRKLREEFGEEV